MSEVESSAIADAPASGQLDPFGYLADVPSRIAGLKDGTGQSHDPGYVFHTSYVAVRPGPASFTLRFTGLTARRGTLVVRVNMLSTEPGAHARLVTSERILLNRLVARGGTATIAFEAYPRVLFAIWASIPDATDAAASGLTITLDQSDGTGEGSGHAADARSTAFGSEALRPTAQLVSLDRPTLADPVSQPCTRAQCAEPIYRAWARDLGEVLKPGPEQWGRIYILQALRRYGMLATGARGLGFGVGDERLPAAVAAAGVAVTATDLPGIVEDGRTDGRVTFRTADMRQIPADLVDFDFLWSSAAAEHLGSIAQGLHFIERALACLRPGGMAVHTVRYNLASNEDTLDNADPVFFRRRDLERLALRLISRGHEVAQIRADHGIPLCHGNADAWEPGDQRSGARLQRFETTAFGIIIRKVRTPL